MDAQTCLHLLREIKDVSLATINEEGHPEIRIIDMMLEEEGALIFCTSRGKDFYAQLERDSHIAIDALTKDWKMVRLMGTAERIKDDPHAWIDRIFRENPSMDDIYPGDSRYALEPFRIAAGEVELFDLGTSPIERHTFALGAAQPKPHGFKITDACIGCGKCARVSRRRRFLPAGPTPSCRTTACTAASASRAAPSRP